MADPTSPMFPQAVASFEPTSTGVLLWTRLAAGATEASWAIARDPSMERRRGSGAWRPRHRMSTTPSPCRSTASTPRRATGTSSTAGGERSPVGRTRTLPAEGATAFRIATVCCADYAVAPLGVYRAVAEREVDLVLHLGDYIYEKDGVSGRPSTTTRRT